MHTLLVILTLRRDVGHVSSAIREGNVIGCLSRIVREAYSIDDKVLKRAVIKLTNGEVNLVIRSSDSVFSHNMDFSSVIHLTVRDSHFLYKRLRHRHDRRNAPRAHRQRVTIGVCGGCKARERDAVNENICQKRVVGGIQQVSGTRCRSGCF